MKHSYSEFEQVDIFSPKSFLSNLSPKGYLPPKKEKEITVTSSVNANNQQMRAQSQ